MERHAVWQQLRFWEGLFFKSFSAETSRQSETLFKKEWRRMDADERQQVALAGALHDGAVLRLWHASWCRRSRSKRTSGCGWARIYRWVRGCQRSAGHGSA